MSRRRSSSPLVVVGVGDFGFLPDLYPRESGTLALSRPDGSELRLHRTDRGLWELLDWREAAAHDGQRQWVGAVAGPIAAGEWVACGRAMTGGPGDRIGEDGMRDDAKPEEIEMAADVRTVESVADLWKNGPSEAVERLSEVVTSLRKSIDARDLAALGAMLVRLKSVDQFARESFWWLYNEARYFGGGHHEDFLRRYTELFGEFRP